ncbi:MAG: hypothetical protein Q4P33_09610 [Flaviflexus sp.]|nr:hypothetical protein [Flaviflexus sp.]
MQSTSRSLAALVIAAVIAVGGCSSTTQSDEPTKNAKPASLTNPVEIAHAAEPTDGADLEASNLPGQLFTQAQLVIATDEEHLPGATSAAVALGAPVLRASDHLGANLADLGVRYAIAFGTDEQLRDEDVLVLEESQVPDMVSRLGIEPSFAPAPEDLPSALTGLEPGTLFMANPNAPAPAEPESEAATEREDTFEGAAPDGTGDADSTNAAGASAGNADDADAPTGDASDDPSESAEPSEKPTLPQEIPPLVAGTAADFAMVTNSDDPIVIAQARAAGADVHLLREDPRSSSVSTDMPSPYVTVFDEEMAGKWRVATAGVELPGGGQLVFDGKRYVALYGNPASPALGVLGEQDTPATVARAAEVARLYEELTDDTVIPALEIIVTVASGAPGDDGNYSNEWDPDGFIDLIEAAEEAGQYVILDFQPGRSDFLTQVKQYEKLLAYPHVGIALDPEWRLGPEEMPLTRIGHVEASEVNEVIDYLADYVRDHDLPQKALILHQFQLQMLRDRDQIDISRPELAVVIHADGQGSQGAKASTWETLHTDAPDVHWGWKNFYDEDIPLLSPEGTYQVNPTPDFVSYQ